MRQRDDGNLEFLSKLSKRHQDSPDIGVFEAVGPAEIVIDRIDDHNSGLLLPALVPELFNILVKREHPAYTGDLPSIRPEEIKPRLDPASRVFLGEHDDSALGILLPRGPGFPSRNPSGDIEGDETLADAHIPVDEG